ncbi:MAG: AraC family transcriptional regulator [Bacteroidetes bacterium]|nr:MAG: AraC family transcriptional regulator [Bacteroidota bacterium]
MEIFTIPDLLVGENKGPVNILFYQRENGPDQIKLKLHYAQNMLCFMLKGVKELIDETTRYSMNNEQIGLVSSGNMLMNERVTLREEFESLLLFFSNEFLANFLKKYNIVIQDDPEEHPPVIVFPKDDYLQNFQQSMTLLRNDFNRETFRVAKMEEILLYLYEKYPSQIRGFIAKSIAKTENRPLVQVVQNHMFDNLNAQELAFLCNMSISTFKRKFTEVYDTSPGKYFVTQRMKHAVLMLRNRRRPSDIYLELGYENLSSFSREFKKFYGVPPKSYAVQN